MNAKDVIEELRALAQKLPKDPEETHNVDDLAAAVALVNLLITILTIGVGSDFLMYCEPYIERVKAAVHQDNMRRHAHLN
jgi:hypothetical protein